MAHLDEETAAHVRAVGRPAGDTPDMLDERLPCIPDDWAVWAFSDVHGVTSALVTALQQAGILDEALHWIAPPRTALVGCGDYVDRGGDVRGLLELLRRLQADAAAVGGRVHLARGNHEAMPMMIRRGAGEWLETWLEYGGRATLGAFGCPMDGVGLPDGADLVDGADQTAGGDSVDGLLGSLSARAPWLFGWLEGLPHAVRWRDVLFVHGGLPPGWALGDLGTRTDEHLWVRSAFFDTPWEAGAFEGFTRDGIERVVFGHTPQWSGPALFHGGRSLDIDTNAVGDPRMPPGAVQELTLVGLAGDGSFEGARMVTVPTADAPERMGR
jgi:hypothetical protein